jgi:hypothetical protein
MQVLCKHTTTNAEVHCRVCGQGFLIYWARTSRTEREAARLSIVEGLATHHTESASPHAHPRTGFSVPSWPGPPAFTFAPLFGGAHDWSI